MITIATRCHLRKGNNEVTGGMTELRVTGNYEIEGEKMELRYDR